MLIHAHPQKTWRPRYSLNLFDPRTYTATSPMNISFQWRKKIAEISWITRQVRGKSFEPWKKSPENQDVFIVFLWQNGESCKVSPKTKFETFRNPNIHQNPLRSSAGEDGALFFRFWHVFHPRLAPENEKVSVLWLSSHFLFFWTGFLGVWNACPAWVLKEPGIETLHHTDIFLQ